MHQAVARRKPAWSGILIGGLIAGTLDLTYAIVFSGFHGVPADAHHAVGREWLARVGCL